MREAVMVKAMALKRTEGKGGEADAAELGVRARFYRRGKLSLRPRWFGARQLGMGSRQAKVGREPCRTAAEGGEHAALWRRN